MSNKERNVKHTVMSDRGIDLEVAVNRQSCNSVGYGQTVTVDGAKVRIGDTCTSCGLRIRGVNHENGHHHKKRVPSCGKR